MIDKARIIKHGYFPKELPPCFTSFPFGKFIEDIGLTGISSKYTSRPCSHNLARSGNQRRLLSIPNPINYYLIADLLDQNSHKINELLKRSTISISTPVLDISDYRSIRTKEDGRDLPLNRARIRSGRRFSLRTDIARFYHSIYTHSIPWAIDGKDHAKSHRSEGFGNELDKLIRNSQDGQTLGIPVGPDASLLIAEIISSSLDLAIEKNKYRGFRFMDDYEFTFLTRSEAEQALPVLESILRDFELGLNPLKTVIDELPTPFESPWTLRIRRFSLDSMVSTSQLLEFFDVLFDLYNSNKTEPVLKYGIARLRDSEFEDDQMLIKLLYQCILIEPGTLQETLYLTQKLNIQVDNSELGEILFDLISIHAPMRHGSEVAWALWACIFYRINIPKKISNFLEDYEDNCIALLALHAYSLGLISKTVNKYWNHLMTRDSLSNGNWLIAYEANIKGWLTTIDEKDHVGSHEYFKILKKNGVSFYDEEVDYIIDKSQLDDSYNEPANADNSVIPNDDDLPF